MRVCNCIAIQRFCHLSKKKVILILIVLIVVASYFYYREDTLVGVLYKKYREHGHLEHLGSPHLAHVVRGLGDLGKPAAEPITAENEVAVKLGWQRFGYNAWLSERIPLERKLADVRDKRCLQQSYGSNLPTVSIIITHHNEQLSVVLRTLYSIWNRTPHEILADIVLVNDRSDSIELNATDLEGLVGVAFDSKVQLINLEEQMGLIRARMRGAHAARGEVLVFLDAHVEVTEGWLPPLLKPIETNPKVCTTPLIDTIDYDTFEYKPGQPARGAFNWDFNYVQIPLLAAERAALPAPHNNPIMNGGLFAINAQWFWHLGAYDEELNIWGGEQFELSFKLWLCGGKILQVPCARVGHLFRHGDFKVKYTHKDSDLSIARNFKRVIEVWLDEYRDFVYMRTPRLTLISAGDLRKQKELRKRLHCKSFKWFIEQVAPDLLTNFPTVEPPDYAFGALQSIAAPQLCLTAIGRKKLRPAMRGCPNDLKYPENRQSWSLSFRRDLRQREQCLEIRERSTVWFWPCHLQGGNQFWSYDQQKKILVQGGPGRPKHCLQANSSSGLVFLTSCDPSNPDQQWRFGYINETALDSFYKGLNGTELEN